MEKQILDRLDSFVATHKKKSLYVVHYKGNTLVLPSGKSSWGGIGAAKNAVRNALGSLGDWRTRLAAIKEMEDKGVIEYVKLF